MAPSAAAVGDFQHVEILGIGRSKKFLQPPGGYSHGIFGDGPRELQQPVQVAKVRKNYSKSDIFGFSSDSSSSSSFSGSPPQTPKLPPLDKTTKHRLFGPPDENANRRRRSSSYWLHSTLFAPPDPLPRPPPRPKSARNPITGENCLTADQPRCQTPSRKIQNPITGEGIAVKSVANPRRTPPGGKTTLVLDYNE